MRRTPEQKYHFDQLKSAIESVCRKLNPPTLGPCHYCDWPITNCYKGRTGELVRVCDLCLKFTDTIFTRRWEDEEPANVI